MSPINGAAIERAVEALPRRWRGLTLGTEHLVVGPTGAFALTDAVPTIEQAADRVARAATDIREFLATVGSWAPFVDPLVVVDGPVVAVARATIVPAHLLGGVLAHGPHVLTDVEVIRIAERLESRHARVAV